MTRLCIIGNSHAAALKLAAPDFCSAHPEAQLTFFAAPSRRTGQLMLENGVYRAGTPELAQQLRLTSVGQDAIDPAEHDAFLIYGFGGRCDTGDRPRKLSAAFRQAVVLDRARQSLLQKHMTALRHLTDAPVFAALTPLPGESATRKSRRLLRHSEEVALVQQNLCTPLGVTLCAQPEASLVRDRATQARFVKHSAPLENALKQKEAQHDTDERRHMNADYGLLWLEAFWPLLSATLDAVQGPEAQRLP